MSVRIMVVDDHALVRAGICRIISDSSKYEIVAEAADGNETISILDTLVTDVILLDIEMPGFSGISTLVEIKKFYPKIKVIMLTAHTESDFLIRSINHGADGYLSKECNIDELFLAIDTVVSGNSYIQSSLAAAMNRFEANRNSDKEKIDGLTKREIEILKQIAGGRFNKEIADSLDITERTVKNHISNLFKKIDVNDRTQAAVFAIRNNLVNLY